MKLPPFAYEAPHSLVDALRMLSEHGPEARPIAGGQSLIPVLAFRLGQPTLLVDLRNIPGLDHITLEENAIRIGARVRWADILEDRLLRAELPLLVEAVRHIAHYQVRNRGTVGGSLAHGDFAAELPAIALACDATMIVEGVAGRREIPAADFFVAPLTTALNHDELLLELRLPRWTNQRRWGFQEFARQRGAFALGGVVVAYDDGEFVGNARLVPFGGVSSLQRATNAEAYLHGRSWGDEAVREAARLTAESADVTEDVEAPAEYRRALVETLTTRALVASRSR